MAETVTIARPYAEAAFGIADAGGALAKWARALDVMAQVAAHPEVRAAIGNPRLTDEQVYGLFASLCGDVLTTEVQNLVRVLIENGRLALAPEIRDIFQELKNEREGVVDAVIVSTGEDLAASILATLALRDLGLSEIYVKVTSTAAARAVEALNMRATVFPERVAAERLAQHIVSTAVLDYVPLGDGYSIQQIAIPDGWLGKSLRELELPRVHGIQIVALLDMLTGTLNVVPDADAPLKDSDVAIVAGPDDKIAELLQRSS